MSHLKILTLVTSAKSPCHVRKHIHKFWGIRMWTSLGSYHSAYEDASGIPVQKFDGGAPESLSLTGAPPRSLTPTDFGYTIVGESLLEMNQIFSLGFSLPSGHFLFLIVLSPLFPSE